MSPKDRPDPPTNPFDIPPDTVRTPPKGMAQVTAEQTPLRRSQPPVIPRDFVLPADLDSDETRLHAPDVNEARRRSQPPAAPVFDQPRRRSQPPAPVLGGEDETRLHHSQPPTPVLGGEDETRLHHSQPPTPILGDDDVVSPPAHRSSPVIPRSFTPPPVRRSGSTIPPPARAKSTTTPPRSRTSTSDLPQLAGSIITEDPTKSSGKYAFGEALGRGGMGEVMLAHDRAIGRDVAIKRLRTGSPTEDETSRFLREARIQARLDHPAIVPVYELSRDELGRPFFSMKRVAGKTLVQVLEVGTRLRLLRAFADVCRAVDFAHMKGIVHRDLKPANIVLGEFGEVYVLDWGVARVLGDAAGLVTADIDTMEGSAPANQTLGTPGYMAPEQIEDPEVGRPADVYSLGTILFEILAGEPLHPRDNAVESTRMSTLSTSPAARRPERAIPPELDALCSVMLSKKASVRPTARWCADRVEEYLDGDRDVARRRSMANEMVWAARAALDSGRRAEAMRTASRAMALDPQAEGAGELVTMLMLDPPRTPPEDLRAALQNSDAVHISHHARSAIPGYVLIALFLPLIIINGVLDWSVVLGIVGAALGMAFAAWQLVRKPIRSFAWMVAYAIGNSLLLVLLGRLGGAFAFVPALVSYITASLTTYPAFVHRRVVLISIMVIGFLAPFAFEIGDVMERTWQLRPDGILIHGSAMDTTGTSAMVTIIIASVATVIMAGIQYAKLGRANRDAQHRLVTLAWHLRQLLPGTTPQPQPMAH